MKTYSVDEIREQARNAFPHALEIARSEQPGLPEVSWPVVESGAPGAEIQMRIKTAGGTNLPIVVEAKSDGALWLRLPGEAAPLGNLFDDGSRALSIAIVRTFQSHSKK